MRSLTLRSAPSSRLAATISKSLYAVWVKAPRPLQSPSAQISGRRSFQPVIDHDIAARIGCDAGLLQAEIVGVGATANRKQHMAAEDLRRSLGAVDADGDAAFLARKTQALGVECGLLCLPLPGTRGSLR